MLKSRSQRLFYKGASLDAVQNVGFNKAENKMKLSKSERYYESQMSRSHILFSQKVVLKASNR